jgi:hypothetical protein
MDRVRAGDESGRKRACKFGEKDQSQKNRPALVVGKKSNGKFQIACQKAALA